MIQPLKLEQMKDQLGNPANVWRVSEADGRGIAHFFGPDAHAQAIAFVRLCEASDELSTHMRTTFGPGFALRDKEGKR
jgi:hypothetical protein